MMFEARYTMYSKSDESKTNKYVCVLWDQDCSKCKETVNVIDFEFFGFNVHMGPLESPWSQKVMIHW